MYCFVLCKKNATGTEMEHFKTCSRYLKRKAIKAGYKLICTIRGWNLEVFGKELKLLPQHEIETSLGVIKQQEENGRLSV